MITHKDYALHAQFYRRGIDLPVHAINVLRRAQMTLHRWNELECGDGNDYASWSIERDESTGIPYLCTYPYNGKMRRHRIADREAGALKHIQSICAEHGLTYYHQTDPRGCALYISREPLHDDSYSSHGLACCL